MRKNQSLLWYFCNAAKITFCYNNRMRLNTINKITWDLTPLFVADDDPRIEEEKAQILEHSYKFINKWKGRNDYLENPAVLKEALDEYEEGARNFGTNGSQGYYFGLRHSLEQDNPKLKAEQNKIKDMSIKIANDLQFFTHKLAKVSSERQEQFLTYEPLSGYKHFLEMLFEEAKYLLSEEEEKIINLVGPTSQSNWVKMMSEFLSKEAREVINEEGKKEVKSFSEISSLTNSRNKEVRDEAARVLNDILVKHIDTAEAEINSILEFKKVNDNLRGLERPDLLRHLGDDIETEVVDAMLKAVENRFDISRNYYKLKAKLFGVPKLKYHERNVPYGEAEKEYSWEKSAGLVHKVFNELDPEFGDIFNNMIENGQFDVFPKKGKAGGAFCIFSRANQPIYILLNHTNKLRDVLTIAHESGHAVNDHMVANHQNELNAETPLSTAEVASTFMEDFVLQELFRLADDETKLALMMDKLNDEISTITRQVAAYRFEQEMHRAFREKGYLSKEEIGTLFKKNMEAYMGDFVEQSPGSENWWVYWGHFRRFFYVYSYASGLLISKSLQNSVKQDPVFINKVKVFLSAGSADSPKNIFKKMGIDITDRSFWNSGLDEIERLLVETEALARKLKKI